MEQKRATIFIDVLFCAVILPLIIMMVPVDRWLERYPLFSATLVAYLYTLYYAIRKIHFPALFIRHRYWTIVCFMTIVFGIMQLLTYFPFETAPTHMAVDVREQLRARTIRLLSLVVIGFSLSVELMLELLRQLLIRRDVEEAKQKAELALYKAQVNPHFLFNTLNSIYGLVVSKSDRAEQAFVKFTDILQYMYRHATDDTIGIQEEIAYISQYIDLQSLRLNRHTRVVWDHDTDNEDARIPPMMLITFVENAFKYGTSPDADGEIRIRLLLAKGNLRFETTNPVVRGHMDSDPSVGIRNVRSRLQLLYPQRFTLDIGKHDGLFKVCLNIHLQ